MTSVVADHACSGSVEGGNDEVRQCLVAQLGSASEQRLLVRRDLHIDSLRLGVLHFACLPLCRSLGDHDLSSSLQQAPSQLGKAAELTYVVLIVCIDSDPGARIPPPQRTIQG